MYRDEISIDAVQPASGDLAGGTPVTVVGEGFTPDTKVLIDGRLLIDLTVVDEATVLGIAPPGAATRSVDVLAFTPWSNVVAKNAFRYTTRPTIDEVVPPAAPADAPVDVLLVGAGLGPDAQVTFGGIPVDVLDVTSDGLEVRVAAQAPGSVDVRVDTPEGSALRPGGFTFVGDETDITELLAVTPNAGPVGQTVSLVAHGLVDAADTVVRFGQTSATVQSVTPPIAVVIAPEGAGTVAVTVETTFGTSTLPAAFSYQAAPTIATVGPSSGSVIGGDTMTITGTHFAGDTDVYVGALPAQVIEQSDTQLKVITPPGSPGLADVRVIRDGLAGIRKDAFEYTTDGGPELYAIWPNYGAIAGNTLVHVYGAGFTDQTTVKFENLPATEIIRVSSTELLARAPKAAEPDTVDIFVKQGLDTLSLADSYSYFDPYSPYGGAWGPDIDETVNITVLDLYTTEPIPQAFVMLWSDPETPNKGLTDGRGQITFSALDIQGAQMVTAAKAQYTAFSVVEYDAENITVHLIPYNPPANGGGGGGGEGLPGGILKGKVSGLGKYAIVPPQTCEYMAGKGLVGSDGTASCQSCESDSDCGEAHQCADVAEAGNYCLKTCTDDFACPTGYICSSGKGGSAACLPDPGKKAAWCQPSHYRLWEAPPTPATPTPPLDDGSRSWVDDAGNYQMEVRLGEIAVICVGGVIRDPADKVGSFLPLIMGVARNIEAESAKVKEGIDVALEIPLNKDIPLRLDGAPTIYKDPYSLEETPTTSRLRVAFDFGAEGYWTVMDEVKVASDRFVLAHQPASMSDTLDGVTYTFLAEVTGGMNGESSTQAYKVKVLDTDRTFRFVDGAWKAVGGGVRQDIHALWGSGLENLWAVGADGLIAHQKNGAWLTQFSPTPSHLRGLFGTAPHHVVAVGSDGVVLTFDAVTWSLESTPTTSDLRAVWGTAPDNMYAVGQGVAMHRGDGGWALLPGGPATTLTGAWGPHAGALWATGEDGRVWTWDSAAGSWTSADLGSASGLRLHAISGSGPDDVWAVGDLGAVFHFDGADWTQLDVPTAEHLRGVFAAADGTMLAVGDRGVLLRWDGFGFSATTAPKYGGDLQAVWDFPEAEDGGIAAGTQVVSLGPMLSFPVIGEPVPQGLSGSTFTYHLDWTAEPSASPTFNFVEMLAGAPTYAFPAWWTVTAADTWAIDFPNLFEIQSINPFPATSLMMKVNRVLKPGASADNFDFWDTYDRSGWTSWSSDAVFFTPGL